MQTVQTQIRRRKLRRLVRDSTVCLQNVLINLNKNDSTTRRNLNGNGLGQLIRLEYESVHEISNNVVCATSKVSDQPAHTRSLIRAFAGRLSII